METISIYDALSQGLPGFPNQDATQLNNFNLFVSQAVFYVVAATVVIACVCVCILLIRKVISEFKKKKQ
ncbi:hypothetical protein SDC9_111831 [bioreactor metagenome]|uniref:Uncharacterized protein n=1 Tax=bioreactor metagenome TaxID=1076179 RepID=A0A645BHJ4_9ZZZZ